MDYLVFWRKQSEDPIIDYRQKYLEECKKIDYRLFEAYQKATQIYDEIEKENLAYKRSKDYQKLDSSSSIAATCKKIIVDHDFKIKKLEDELRLADKKIDAIEETIAESKIEHLEIFGRLNRVADEISTLFIDLSIKYWRAFPSRDNGLLYIGALGIYLSLFRALYRKSDYFFPEIEERLREMMRKIFNELDGIGRDYKVIIDMRDSLVEQLSAKMSKGMSVKTNIMRVEGILREKRISVIDDAFCMVFMSGIEEGRKIFLKYFDFANSQ